MLKLALRLALRLAYLFLQVLLFGLGASHGAKGGAARGCGLERRVPTRGGRGKSNTGATRLTSRLRYPDHPTLGPGSPNRPERSSTHESTEVF